ncbi:MAG: Na(+)/H(+) antiporter subunit D, partial [Desulfobacula sp.]|nr:Na(+)/H(+) antiporter subunit D [Desulfobacula sp.]
ALLILSGYYPPEIKSINLDVDWFYRKLGRGGYIVLDKGLNTLNMISEGVVMGFIKGLVFFFKNTAAKIALFVAVNIWLALGYRDKRLEIKKNRLYNDILEGTLPIGIGAAVTISFILIVFVLT